MQSRSPLRFLLDYPVISLALLALFLLGGLYTAPMDWDLGISRNPVNVDAVPDLGENQQIVFTEWMGRSPQDIEDQVTYPLTVTLMSVPGIKTVRSTSMFGISSIYLIFEEDVDFYWARSRVLEKLSSLPPKTLPMEVQPVLGPDATGLGQVFWYTLEGRDPHGNTTGGWSLEELRTIQDWHVRYALQSVHGVSEVAGVGGHVREYQVDVNPDALRAFNVSLDEVIKAVQESNLDVGARTLEINQVEYVVRGIGSIQSEEDLRSTVVTARHHTPVTLSQLAHISVGPALRRGILDKGGAEVAGGVVTVRYKENPLNVIEGIHQAIDRIAPGLPKKTLADGTVSQVTIVPFYDRTQLIHETLDTLSKALSEEILVTVLVVLLLVRSLGSAALIAGMLPLAVLMTFMGMRAFGVEANVVALSGIAIAIGTMVDMGIVITENILRHRKTDRGKPSDVVFKATREVAPAVMTALATTVISFLPVFAMTGVEGKMFKPLATTKTMALIAAGFLAVTLIPSMAAWGLRQAKHQPPPWVRRVLLWATAATALVLLLRQWNPLELSPTLNTGFVLCVLGTPFLLLMIWYRYYSQMLAWSLVHKKTVVTIAAAAAVAGTVSWLGVDRVLPMPEELKQAPGIRSLRAWLPGMGREFMPPLDEGSFLFMPTTMPHASLGEAHDVLRKQDAAITAVPEVASAVGKIGRAESALDPAPVSMIETVILYYPEYHLDDRGKKSRYKFYPDSVDYMRDLGGEPVNAPDGMHYLVQGAYARDSQGSLLPDSGGRPYRMWREPLDPDLNPGRVPWTGVQTQDDIWSSITAAARVPGTTDAPKLQPIAARQVMLQSGMRAPLGIKVQGASLADIESFSLSLEPIIRNVPGVDPATVFADRIAGKPYLEIRIDRAAIAHHGIRLRRVQQTIEAAVGGKLVTTTVEGRERYSVRVRYMRELRDNLDALDRILVAAPDGSKIPLGQLAGVVFVKGPQVIKSEDTFLTGHVIFDAAPGETEVEIAERVKRAVDTAVTAGLPIPIGVSYIVAGTYENQVRARKTLQIVLPLALGMIFLTLYLQFGSSTLTGIVFSSIAVAWAGGFLMLFAYSQSWFWDLPGLGNLLESWFNVRSYNLSVAVWVGFLALFGIATDNGVILATYLKQSFNAAAPSSVASIHGAVCAAGERRIRACVMTTATTLLALIPVMTSVGRGSEIMVPMAIPSFGGMTAVLFTTLLVPVLFSWWKERGLKQS